MVGRLDPPHDRLRLSADELRTFRRIEQELYDDAERGGRRAARRQRVARLRVGLLGAVVRWARLGPWLMPIGASLMLAALSVSVLLSAVGAALVAVGASAAVRRPWFRRQLGRLSVVLREPRR